MVFSAFSRGNQLRVGRGTCEMRTFLGALRPPIGGGGGGGAPSGVKNELFSP